MICEECGGSEDVTTRAAMTAYYWDGTGENPNAPVTLCKTCMDDYCAYWQSMWDEYHSSQGCY